MFDGSHYPIDENVAKTKELVAVAHAMGMSIAVSYTHLDVYKRQA